MVPMGFYGGERRTLQAEKSVGLRGERLHPPPGTGCHGGGSSDGTSGPTLPYVAETGSGLHDPERTAAPSGKSTADRKRWPRTGCCVTEPAERKWRRSGEPIRQ